MQNFLDEIYENAKADKVFLTELLFTLQGENAMFDFCLCAQKHGIDVTVGDFLGAGESYSCNQLKSTNGGGVNPYAYFDDPFEMLCVQLESLLIDK